MNKLNFLEWICLSPTKISSGATLKRKKIIFSTQLLLAIILELRISKMNKQKMILSRKE
jgi:hypothetical protein